MVHRTLTPESRAIGNILAPEPTPFDWNYHRDLARMLKGDKLPIAKHRYVSLGAGRQESRKAKSSSGKENRGLVGVSRKVLQRVGIRKKLVGASQCESQS